MHARLGKGFRVERSRLHLELRVAGWHSVLCKEISSPRSVCCVYESVLKEDGKREV